MRLSRFHNRLNRQHGDSVKRVRPYMVDSTENQKQKVIMDATNEKVLKQIQEYAAMYFAAIVERNTTNGKCQLKPGKYSAREIADSVKAACGTYELPEDPIFDESVEIAADNFKCHFPYRQIFRILAQWEAMCKTGKQKVAFEIGDVEERSAKAIFQGKTALGKYAETKVKMQRVCGNWWMPSKFKKSDYNVELFYELNGVIFVPGLRFSSDMILNRREEVEARCAQYDDAKMTEMTISFLAKFPGSEHWGYFKEVADRAGIDMESEEAAATIEKAKEEKRKHDEEEARELAEIKARAEETRRKLQEEEERIKRKIAESLAKTKEDFVSGKMIRRNDFELIAESVGYEINIRTVGTLRKRVEWIEVEADGTPTVYGTKRRAGLEGTFAVIREVYAMVKAKAQAEEEAIKIKPMCETTCEERPTLDDHEYYTWLMMHEEEGSYMTIADKALAEALAWIFEAAYRKGKGHIIAMNKDGVLIETVIAATPTETPQISTEAAEPVNVSAEGGNAAETEQIGRMPEGREAKCRLAPTWAAKKALKDGYTLYCFNLYPNGEFTISVENKNGCRILTKDEFRKLCTEPPQSPETPKAVECTTDAPKPRETARKEPKRVIRNFRTTQPRTCKNFLIVQSVPRLAKRSTAHHIADVSKMVYSAIMPSGYVPPIRGDCVNEVDCQWLPDNR